LIDENLNYVHKEDEMSEYKKIRGRISSLSPMEANGKRFFKIEVMEEGRQYPIKGSTWDDPLAYKSSEVLDISYSEKPAIDKATGQQMVNKFGKPVNNRTFLLPNHICKDGSTLASKNVTSNLPPLPQATGLDSAKLEARITLLEERLNFHIKSHESGAGQDSGDGLPPQTDEDIPF
jgi:hypothetical protein